MKNSNNYVAIMAGGIGSRFWPISRENYPKQFLDILNTGKSLLQSTFDRFAKFIPVENIYVVTSAEYIDIVAEQLPQITKNNIIGEPERKNTAPCVAYISFKLNKINPNANLIVAPSDHLIQDEVAFEHNCTKALDYTCKNNALVTLGIKPTYANTGYGYIQFEKEGNNTIYPVKRFTEKPNLETATDFFKSGLYLWNAGIFIWKTTDILSAFRLFAPDMYDAFSCGADDFNTDRENEAAKHSFKYCENVSIDYAIMEKAKNVFVIPADFTWSDLGTWNSAWENYGKDSLGNAIAGDNTILMNAKDCIVHSTDKKLIMVGGVENLIIVNTPDAFLICKKENEQEIKEYLRKVRTEKGNSYL